MFCIPFGSVHLQTANIDTTKEAALEIAFEMSKDLGSNLYDIQILPYCPRQDMIGSSKIYEILGTPDKDYDYIYANNNTVKSIIIWCKKSTDGFTAAAENTMEIYRPTDATTKTKTVTTTDGRVTTNSYSGSHYSRVTIQDDSIKDLANVTVTGVSLSKGSYNASSSGIHDQSYSETLGSIMGEIYTEDWPTGSSDG